MKKYLLFLGLAVLLLLPGGLLVGAQSPTGRTRLGNPLVFAGKELARENSCPHSVFALLDDAQGTGLDQALSPNYSGCGGEIAPIINDDYEQEVVELVNAERAARALPPLKRVTELGQSSRYHATDMGQDDYFDHDTFDRVAGDLVLVCDTWSRIQTYYSSPRAENIAAGYGTPEIVMDGWMDSTGHRNNILSTSSWEIGVGYYEGSGSYNRYWVQNFGLRSGQYPLIINQEAASTSSPNVTVYVYGDWDEIRLRNNDGDWSAWQAFQSETSWTLKAVRGEQTVWAEMRAGSDNATSSDTIFLDLVAIGPDSVSISGPTTGLVETDYNFTADVEPDTADQPITYVWQATDLPPVTHTGGLQDAVEFNWNSPGVKTLQVTVSNAGGSASDTFAVAVQAPLSDVQIDGPTAGFINTSYTFAATAAPAQATTPITYVWQISTEQGASIVTHAGGLEDDLTWTWEQAGVYTVSLMASNPTGSQVTAEHVIDVEPGPSLIIPPGSTLALTLVYTDSQGNPTIITVPPQSVDYPTTLYFIPLTSTQPVSPGWVFANHAFRLEAYQNGQPAPTLVLMRPLTITLFYSQADVLGIMEDALALYFWRNDQWVNAALTCGDTAVLPPAGEGRLELAVCELGEFALFGPRQEYSIYLPVVLK